MDKNLFEVEPFTAFSKSRIWQLNRSFYQDKGIDAWSTGEVPHYITSNSSVGKTYAEMILAFLQDLALKGNVTEKVYIVDLGAGHGRLAFHILKHIERLRSLLNVELPPLCYVLTDIVEKNLSFFKSHPQLQSYLNSGELDYAYYDAMDGEMLHLRHQNIELTKGDLEQPIIAIANYFFDSIPNDLFHIQNNQVSACNVALQSTIDPATSEIDDLLKSLESKFEEKTVPYAVYRSKKLNDILENYRLELSESFVFFPAQSIACLNKLRSFSKQGLMVLSMDKGFHTLQKLDKRNLPELITHGSFSLWVNYHALGEYCEAQGGKHFFPANSNFHLQVVCLLFMPKPNDFYSTHAAYQRHVNDFGPDDFNSIKKMSYDHMKDFSLIHLLAILRLSSYDSAMFMEMLPSIKEHAKKINYEERGRIAQCLDEVWNYYFNINEKRDLAVGIAGLFFDLGYYEKAIAYYKCSSDVYGAELDTSYNRILCYYQLRQDDLFMSALAQAKLEFPNEEVLNNLDRLDLGAV